MSKNIERNQKLDHDTCEMEYKIEKRKNQGEKGDKTPNRKVA